MTTIVNDKFWSLLTPSSSPTLQSSGTTYFEEEQTLMLRNIPNKYTQGMVLHALRNDGFYGSFDFFYLPIDFRNRCNVGYAFINFKSGFDAERFRLMYDGRKLGAFNSTKVCQVSPARVQGLVANVEHYRNSPVNGIPVSQYRPLILDRHGRELPFPPPDVPLAPVRLRTPKI